MSELPATERIPIPGCWNCPRCGFQLTKSVICTHPSSPGVFVDPSAAREVCPNDGMTLEQVYESPDDQLVVFASCCPDPDCRECYGTGQRGIGWRYRDEKQVRPFSERGDRAQERR